MLTTMLTCWHGVLLVERNATDVAGLAVHEDPRSGTGVARAQRGKANGMPSTLLIDGNINQHHRICRKLSDAEALSKLGRQRAA
jgi:hypothetical protein